MSSGKLKTTPVNATYLATEDLINGRRLFERTFVNHTLSHLLHEEHERVQRLLDVVLPRRPARRRPRRRPSAAAGRRQALGGRGVVGRPGRRRRPVTAVSFIS